MTAHTNDPDAGSAKPRRGSIAAGVYALLAVAGLLATWYFNLSFAGDSYLGGWFANDASSSAAVDILVAFVACAVAFAFPLFLALRERVIDRAPTRWFPWQPGRHVGRDDVATQISAVRCRR